MTRYVSLWCCCSCSDIHTHNAVDDRNVSGRRWRAPRHRLLGTSRIVAIRIQANDRLQLTDPDGHAMHKILKQSTGTVSITATKIGRHEYCFSNQMSTVVDKLVRCVFQNLPVGRVLITKQSFNVHGILFVDDDGACFAYLRIEDPNSFNSQTPLRQSREKFVPSLPDLCRSRTSRSTSLSESGHIATQQNPRTIGLNGGRWRR